MTPASPPSSLHARLRAKLGDAIRDLILTDDPETTARALSGFLEPLRTAPLFAQASANHWRRSILSLADPTATDRLGSHPLGALYQRVLRFTSDDKGALRAAMWDLYNYLMRDGR